MDLKKQISQISFSHLEPAREDDPSKLDFWSDVLFETDVTVLNDSDIANLAELSKQGSRKMSKKFSEMQSELVKMKYEYHHSSKE